MRRLVLLAMLLAGCAKTYAELAPFDCPEDHLCPDPFVCVLVNGTGECRDHQPCTLGGNQCSDPDRQRCTLMKTAARTVKAECTVQYGTGAEGTECSVLLYTRGTSFAVGQGLGDQFPGEDRFCANGLICHNLPMLPAASGVTSGKCRRFCKADADCGSASIRCLDAFGKTVTDATVALPDKTGVCYPACTLLGTGECTAGTACQVAIDVN
jgi:hypothetical protein